ncbi:hypothetical protein BGW42_004313 [Actinomortierella wolfii]|nr:hypothetical protein BGW42_004313 [Actinomortierella wolfii]KAG0239326.1 hypothetical protein BGW41_007811 [Actinomortierella wolfii]
MSRDEEASIGDSTETTPFLRHGYPPRQGENGTFQYGTGPGVGDYTKTKAHQDYLRRLKDLENDGESWVAATWRDTKRGVRMCLWWFLIIILSILFLTLIIWAVLYFGDDGTCSGVLGTEATVLFEARAEQYDSVKFEIKGNMAGLVTVKEADSWMDKSIGVNIQIQASNEDLMSKVLAMTTAQLNSGVLEALIDISETRMRSSACARANVVISYPRAISSSKELTVIASRGSFEYTMDERLLNVENMKVHFEKGSINVRGSVSDLADLKTDNGQIKARLLSEGEIKANVKTGSIYLDVDSQTPRKLDISARSHSGSAQVQLRQVFEGHFSIESNSGSVQLSPAGDRNAHVYFEVDELRKKVGWISHDENEPSNALPRIDVFSSSGQAIIDIR